ncbi:MAG: helix-turn-helix transcriptional regulator, partial [Clostridium saudiense]|nr:helix-turn-helix transcriptional regulator [Clostridium saudiense]
VQDVLDKFKNILNIMRKHVSIVKKILCVKYGRLYMAVSYDKLWKLLIDKKMNKTQLCEKAKISTNAMARLGRNEDVRVEVLTRICLELGCSMDEILEILPEKR